MLLGHNYNSKPDQIYQNYQEAGEGRAAISLER